MYSQNRFPELFFLRRFFISRKRKSGILPLVLILLLAACQPTPEEAFVLQNDQEKMLETAQKVDEIPEQTAEEREAMPGPEAYQNGAGREAGAVGREEGGHLVPARATPFT